MSRRNYHKISSMFSLLDMIAMAKPFKWLSIG